LDRSAPTGTNVDGCSWVIGPPLYVEITRWNLRFRELEEVRLLLVTIFSAEHDAALGIEQRWDR
jgi:hypothetical protein